jgi:uncharacterized protein
MDAETEMSNKLITLKQIISGYPSAVIAFSGGVDSTFLARVAKDELKGNVLLVTAASSTYPAEEMDSAVKLAEMLELPHKILVSEELDIPGFSQNTPDRCYFCKKELFQKIKGIALSMGYEAVFDGSNKDDELHDYRPGLRAISELGIISPLREAGLTKEDIRKYSAQYSLSTASKPSLACLASRFPYGDSITAEKLGIVGRAESSLRKLGFSQIRVRIHGQCARIEFIPDEMETAWKMRSEITRICRDAGFIFTSIDTSGYRTGAMNEVLPDNGLN